jgi:N-acetylglucosaminyldiphosphoundecaprenol N-acetyl-beta-D-mannosaminyltransferase
MIDAGKRSVLGIMIDVVDYEAATERILAAARQQRPLALTALAVHGVMTGVHDPAHAARLNSFDLATPDGQPVRWTLNWLYRAGLTDRVYGPTLTMRVLERCATESLPVYLYGSTDDTLQRLTAVLNTHLPELKIAGVEPSKFRQCTPGEAEQIADRIRTSGARVVLVGLGCPRQEVFTYAMRPHLNLPLLAVGAAFDYHAGLLRVPPAWMQRAGLEWVWRLGLEPRRLWRRYLLLNPAFVARLAAHRTGLLRRTPAAPATEPLPTFPA